MPVTIPCTNPSDAFCWTESHWLSLGRMQHGSCSNPHPGCWLPLSHHFLHKQAHHSWLKQLLCCLLHCLQTLGFCTSQSQGVALAQGEGIMETEPENCLSGNVNDLDQSSLASQPVTAMVAYCSGAVALVSTSHRNTIMHCVQWDSKLHFSKSQYSVDGTPDPFLSDEYRLVSSLSLFLSLLPLSLHFSFYLYLFCFFSFVEQ